MHGDPQRIDAMLDQIRSLPLSADGSIDAIVAACDSPHTTMGEIAHRIGREPALTAVVMREANAPAHGFGGKVETLPDAVVLLGIRAIRTLALTNAALRFLAVDRDGLTQLRRGLLTHSVTTAVAARVIARRAGAHPEKAFLCGMVHELGTIIMTRVTTPQYLHAFVSARREGRPFEGVEREVFGFDHAELGARLAEVWRFPTPICDAIAHQHEPGKARLERILAEVLHCADWLAAEMGHGLVPFHHPAWPDERSADTCGLSRAALHELCREVEEEGSQSWGVAA